jgi:hypothetical protein
MVWIVAVIDLTELRQRALSALLPGLSKAQSSRRHARPGHRGIFGATLPIRSRGAAFMALYSPPILRPLDCRSSKEKLSCACH